MVEYARETAALEFADEELDISISHEGLEGWLISLWYNCALSGT
jgi:hypothetical protein